MLDMKHVIFLALIAASATLSGCVVQSSYSKTISVTKDAQGKVVQTVETETVVQPGQGYPMRLQLIKGIQTN
jgi:outer membrane lipoprotein SlyB